MEFSVKCVSEKINNVLSTLKYLPKKLNIQHVIKFKTI